MVYRVDPVSQRDGSSLANSNCRMASVAVGLAYETADAAHPKGAKTSTGAKMRSYTDDQSGGTDSSDAKQSWSRGYNESLRVMDGHTFADAVADLRAGRLVHLDVWAAAVGSAGMCLSDTGNYGHTIAVAPEASGSRWLVADPWCSPPKWQWCESSALQRGAETWANQVALEATQGPPGPIAEVIRRLLSRYRPDDPSLVDADPPETSGGSIYYTTTATQGTSSGGSDEMRFANVNGNDVNSGKRLNVGDGSAWTYTDGGKGGTFSGDQALVWLGTVDSVANHHLVRTRTGLPYGDSTIRDTLVMVESTNKPYDAGPGPIPPNGGGDVDAAVAERDAEWEAWALEGAPSKS